MTGALPILEIADLTVEFSTRRGIVRAVQHVDISIAKGETVGIVGESGSGKSVTSFAVMRILDRAGRIAQGAVHFSGLDLIAASEDQMRELRGREISMVFQNPRAALNPIRKVGHQIEDVLRQHSQVNSAELADKAVEMLDQVRIARPRERYHAYPFELSGGMCQRVVIALALACRPRLLIADEPTTGLDVTTQKTVMDLIVELTRQQGMSTILITHDLGLAAMYCDRVVVMEQGNVVESAASAAIFTSPAHPYTRKLMRATPRPGINLRDLLPENEPGSISGLNPQSHGGHAPLQAGHPLIPARQVEVQPCQTGGSVVTGSSAYADDDDREHGNHVDRQEKQGAGGDMNTQGRGAVSHITIQPELALERVLSLEIVRVTERAAVSAARWSGRGNEKAADQAAVDAMRRELNKLPIDGTVMIGEGERDEAPMLFIGETVGNKHGPKVDIAVDPLEGTTLCAKSMPGAIATMAMAEGGTLLNAPDVYMEKIAIGPGYPAGVVDLDAPAGENIRKLARAKGVQPEAITALILDRPRHAELIASVRTAGAAVRLITDGDVAGVIHTADAANTGIDIYMGVGGAPEGVLAAAALRCIGGQMQCRLVLDTQEKRARAAKMGIEDPRKKYEIRDLVKGECLFSATGVTDGALLKGVRFGKEVITTETVVMRSVTGTVRWIAADHRQLEKFYLD